VGGMQLKTNMKWEEKVVTHSIDLTVLQNGIKLSLHSLDVTYCLSYETMFFGPATTTIYILSHHLAPPKIPNFQNPNPNPVGFPYLRKSS
jgi:hypothetical protein